MVTPTSPASFRVRKPCPHCGVGFQALHLHEARCPSNPAQMTSAQRARLPQPQIPAATLRRAAVVPTPAQASPSAEALLLARNEGKTETTSDDMLRLLGEQGREGERAIVTHTTAGKVSLYKPVRTHQGVLLYWRRTPVMASNLAQALRDGFRETCGDCNGQHGNEANDCPARPPRRYRTCPVCRTRIFDPIFEAAQAADEDTDPLAIHDGAYVSTTPEQRTKAALETHLRAWHADEALAHGVLPLPNAAALQAAGVIQ